MKITVRVDLVSTSGRETFTKVETELNDNSIEAASQEAVSDRDARSARNGEDETWTATSASRVRY